MGGTESTLIGNYDIFHKDDAYFTPFGWELHHAKSKVDGSLVSIFKTDTKGACTQNALKKIKMFRHPSILKFAEGNESETTIFFATELAIPLSEWLEYAKGKKKRDSASPIYAYLPDELGNDQLVSWCMWGLASILKGLKFLNEDAKQVHGFIHPSSIFVTQNGSWKIGSFDLSYEFKPKIDPPMYYMDKQIELPADYRCPERTQNNYSLIGDCVVWSQDMYSFGQLIDFVFSGLNIPSQLNNYVLRCKSAPLGRPAPSRLLSAFSKHPLVKSLNFLEEKAIKDPIQKETFFNQLNTSLAKFPPAITVEFILPLLMDELVHGQPEFAPIVLPSVIIIGSNLPADRFSKEISPLITQLFSRKDRATRLQLLKNIDSYINHIDRRVINECLFPQIVIGFGDTSANMRESTIRTMIPLTPHLTVENQGKMVKAMGPLQEDPLPAIRTNVLVCLNKIVAQLDPSVRRQYAFPCIGRGMRDPFPKARIQSLKTIKNTQIYFDDGLIARKILPSLCPLLWDGETSVREAAFDAVQSLLSRIYAGHLEWNKSGVEPKAPIEPEKISQGVIAATSGYVSSAMNWVTGSVKGTKTEDKPQETGKVPTGISSQTVNRVLPAVSQVELSMEQLEALGKPSATSESQPSPVRSDSLDASPNMWGDAPMPEAPAPNGWDQAKEQEKGGIASAGGWGDADDLDFSDEENEQEKKEDQNLQLIKQMAQKKENPAPQAAKETLVLKAKSKAEPMDLDDWANSFNETPKRTSRKTVRAEKKEEKKEDWGDEWDEKPAKNSNSNSNSNAKKSDGWGDDDLFDEKPAKKTPTKKNDGWGDDDLFDEKPENSTSKKDDGWGDDWGEKPAADANPKKNDGWGGDDLFDEKPAAPKKSSSVNAKKSNGWGDDDLFDEKPAAAKKSDGWGDDDLFDEKPAKKTPAKSSGWDDDWDEKPAQKAPVKKSSGWDDDWDEKPTATKKSSGWDDDWDEKPAKKTPAKSSGWDDDIFSSGAQPTKAAKKNDGWDDW